MSSGHTPSSSSVASSKKDGVESMEVDRPHPIAESATPTHMSTTPTTHPSKGHKDRHPHNMYTTTDAAGSRNDEMLSQQNGGIGPFAVPNRKKPHGLKLDAAPIKESPPRRHSISSKSPEVRLTKVTSSPTGKLHPNQFSFNNEGSYTNRTSNSQEMKTHHQLLQSQQGSQDPSQAGGGGVGGGGELSSLWMGGAASSMSSSSQTQGGGSNFLPSFDSDMAFQQLSLTPPSASTAVQQHFPTPTPQHQRQGGQSKGHQGQRSLEQPHHHQLPGQGSHAQQQQHAQQSTSQQQQQQGSQYQQQSYHHHQDVQQQGHQRESPLMRGAPPPYQPPPSGRSGDSSPTPSAFGAPLQHPMSNNPYNSSSVRGHTTSPEKQRTQSPLAFSPHQQQQSMDMLYSSQQQQQGSPNVHHQHQHQQFHRQPQPQVQHGFINQAPPIPGPGPGPGPQQQQHGSGSRTASPLHKQQQSAVERQSSSASHVQQKQRGQSVMERQVSGANPSQQQRLQGPFTVERQSSGPVASPLQQQPKQQQGAPAMEQQQAVSGGPGMNLPVQPQRATERHHQSQQPAPQVNESLSIPTLHDLHNDLHQQQRLRSPLLGIPPFHQIQLNRGTGGSGSNTTSPQSVQGMVDMAAASNTNSPLLSSVQLQNPSPLHPGPGRSVSPHAHGAGARSGSPHTQHTATAAAAGGSPTNIMSPLHQRLTPSQQQSSQHHPQQQQVRTSNISPLHQQARHISPVQQPSPQSMIQQQQQHSSSLQTHSRSPHQQDIQMPQLHQLAQHSSPKRHQLPHTVNLQGPQVQSQNAMTDSSSLLNLGGQFLSQPQQHLSGGGGSPQKIQLYPIASEQQQQQATAILQQQQQQLLQLQHAQAQAQRQFILQQQQQRHRQRSPPYMQGSGSAQAFFPVAGRSSPTASAAAAAMLNTAASTNKQLGHPQLTHLSVLQNLGHDSSLRSSVPSGGNLLNQQSMLMGSNPYATSFGQGLPLLPNGTVGIPGAGTGGVAGFQQPGQSMGGPLRHFHSQGR